MLVDAAAVLVIAVLVALGVWQMHRLAWKQDLIARVDARIHQEPAALPPPERWPQVNAADDEYRRVTATGSFLDSRPALTQAVTELGGGYWVLAPLRTEEGAVVLINRGFVPTDRKEAIAAAPPPEGRVEVMGLLRISEPGGGFLRSNDPSQDRWYSRDVAAIAASRGLTDVAPFFIDAARGAEAPGDPVGGLTVTTFRNSHRSYALTWFAMALLLAGAVLYLNLRYFRAEDL